MKGINKKNTVGHSKTGRGTSKKNLIRCSNIPQPPPSQRTDEDSGLGGDSSYESSVDSSSHADSSHLVGSLKRDLSSDSAHIFYNFGSREAKITNIAKVSTELSQIKRPRLDINDEEANDVPDDKTLVESCHMKQISFKDVPELMIPSKNTSLLHEISLEGPILPESSVKSEILSPQSKKNKIKKRFHPLEGSFISHSSDGASELYLVKQPEKQHRARYQTEGSRGAVKDQFGLGHPSVKLVGYDMAATLRVFVASDDGTVGPHMFYQACKVSGKNSTPCTEENIHGTVVIEIMMDPEQEMKVSCDCVGILKVRNVDVEKKVKMSIAGRKKSTRCRLVFQVEIVLNCGKRETLQVVSQPISCTQPPGIPEIIRKSLKEAFVEGGEDLFIIGKNFLKDTRVIFQEKTDADKLPKWKETVVPDREFIQTTHLICQVPAYHDGNIKSCLDVDLLVVSCGKTSDAHTFTYKPLLKDKPVEYMQIHNLPKGVSPSAVEINRRFTESGEITFPIDFTFNKCVEPYGKEHAVAYSICENVSRNETATNENASNLVQTSSVSDLNKNHMVIPESAVPIISVPPINCNPLPENLAQILKWTADEVLKLGMYRKCPNIQEECKIPSKGLLDQDKQSTVVSEPVTQYVPFFTQPPQQAICISQLKDTPILSPLSPITVKHESSLLLQQSLSKEISPKVSPAVVKNVQSDFVNKNVIHPIEDFDVKSIGENRNDFSGISSRGSSSMSLTSSPLLSADNSCSSSILSSSLCSSPMLNVTPYSSSMLNSSNCSSPMLTAANSCSSSFLNSNPGSPMLSNSFSSSSMINHSLTSSPTLTKSLSSSQVLNNKLNSSLMINNRLRSSPMLNNSPCSSPMLNNNISSSPMLSGTSTSTVVSSMHCSPSIMNINQSNPPMYCASSIPSRLLSTSDSNSMTVNNAIHYTSSPMVNVNAGSSSMCSDNAALTVLQTDNWDPLLSQANNSSSSSQVGVSSSAGISSADFSRNVFETDFNNFSFEPSEYSLQMKFG